MTSVASFDLGLLTRCRNRLRPNAMMKSIKVAARGQNLDMIELASRAMDFCQLLELGACLARRQILRNVDSLNVDCASRLYHLTSYNTMLSVPTVTVKASILSRRDSA